MIDSWPEMRHWIRQDREAFLQGTPGARTLTQPPMVWTYWLRAAEWANNCWRSRPGRVGAKLLWRFVRMRGLRLGYTIPMNTFGPGLVLRHWGTITVNASALVGARCVVHPGVVLGERHGGAPTIGDDCYLGPGAKLYGSIMVGDGCRIGPNAVVFQDIPAGSVVRPALSVLIRPPTT